MPPGSQWPLHHGRTVQEGLRPKIRLPASSATFSPIPGYLTYGNSKMGTMNVGDKAPARSMVGTHPWINLWNRIVSIPALTASDWSDLFVFILIFLGLVYSKQLYYGLYCNLIRERPWFHMRLHCPGDETLINSGLLIGHLLLCVRSHVGYKDAEIHLFPLRSSRKTKTSVMLKMLRDGHSQGWETQGRKNWPPVPFSPSLSSQSDLRS